jgi:hypothetical protein
LIVFLASISLIPVLQAVWEWHRGQRPGVMAIFDQPPASGHLRAYEESLEHRSLLAGPLREWILLTQFSWLRDGGSKVLLGRHGWLYYKPGYDQTVRKPSLSGSHDPAPAILGFRDALAARGIRLMIVPAPNKESIYPDMLGRSAARLRAAPSPPARALLGRLREAGVELVDLFEAFAKERANLDASTSDKLYLAQDSHWSPVGVECAARTVAGRLRELGWAPIGNSAFEVQPAPVERHGDVLRMLKVPDLERRIPAERVICRRIFMASNGMPYRDSPDSEILVLGDSFLRIYEHDEPGASGFVAHLARQLKQPLTSLVSDGGASTLVRQELFRRPELLRNKKIVVWEFVERDLSLGVEGWQIVPLPPERMQTAEFQPSDCTDPWPQLRQRRLSAPGRRALSSS